MNSKKLVSAVLTATTVLWMVGAAALPLANAQTTSSLQAQIAALLAQIATLQSQLNASGSTTGTATTYNFTSDLTIGSKGAQVGSGTRLKSPLTTARLPRYSRAIWALPSTWPAGRSQTRTPPIVTVSP